MLGHQTVDQQNNCQQKSVDIPKTKKIETHDRGELEGWNPTSTNELTIATVAPIDAHP